ncbi:hypothetical protein RRG08_042526 [Elysia crispata]|uniref:Uncharacterized protein n=1 Tax=Elysia crispata TaxID=231223 RepID=A0AAE1CJW9_9GAST|nr:hypothetical protein RRG08_042526 [Elysia crispata]
MTTPWSGQASLQQTEIGGCLANESVRRDTFNKIVLGSLGAGDYTGHNGGPITSSKVAVTFYRASLCHYLCYCLGHGPWRGEGELDEKQKSTSALAN